MGTLTVRPAGRGRLLSIAIAYLAFVSLGLPDGLLGVAWPSMRAGFHVPLDGLGLMLLAGTSGYMLSSFVSGPVAARLGVGPLLASSSALVGLGLAGIMAAPSWWVAVGCGVFIGLGSGAVDGGLNAYAAVHFRPRLMNWLHASFGLGATVGPALMVAVLQADRSWRLGYAIVAAGQVVLAACFALTSGVWRAAVSAATGRDDRRPSGLGTLRVPRVWLGMAVFLVYTGIEVSVGQWTYSLLTESRGVGAAAAGLWVSAYWAALLVGRIVIGFVAEPIGPSRLLRLSMVGAVVGAVLFSLRTPAAATPIGLLVLGWSLAPIFPLLVSTTPARVGSAHTANAVGFQVGAASFGVATLPGAAGLLAGRFGLEAVGPFLIAASLVMLLTYQWLSTLREPIDDRRVTPAPPGAVAAEFAPEPSGKPE
jgi:fucose permease